MMNFLLRGNQLRERITFTTQKDKQLKRESSMKQLESLWGLGSLWNLSQLRMIYTLQPWKPAHGAVRGGLGCLSLSLLL